MLAYRPTSSIARRTAFATNALEPFFVKGKTKAVEAWRGPAVPVEGRSSVTDHRGAPSSVATRELAVLDGAGARRSPASARAVELVGDAGLGKTRLLDEVRSAAWRRLVEVADLCDLYE